MLKVKPEISMFLFIFLREREPHFNSKIMFQLLKYHINLYFVIFFKLAKFYLLGFIYIVNFEKFEIKALLL